MYSVIDICTVLCVPPNVLDKHCLFLVNNKSNYPLLLNFNPWYKHNMQRIMHIWKIYKFWEIYPRIVKNKNEPIILSFLKTKKKRTQYKLDITTKKLLYT
jgi:hypothetical protein